MATKLFNENPSFRAGLTSCELLVRETPRIPPKTTQATVAAAARSWRLNAETLLLMKSCEIIQKLKENRFKSFTLSVMQILWIDKK